MRPAVVSGEVWQLVDTEGPGGIEAHIAILATALRAAGQPVRVFFLTGDVLPPISRTLAAHGVPCEAWDGVRTLDARLRDDRPALLHTHGHKAGIVGRVLGRLSRIPVVSSFHDGAPEDGRVNWTAMLDHALAGLCRPIAASERVRRRLPERARLIEGFVAMPPPVPRDDPRTIAFVGPLSPEKGPDLFCRLAENMPEGRFEMFGDGPMRPALQAAHGVRVRFHGTFADMPACWDRIGLLCVTSRCDGLPPAVIEAMAHGVPVAAFAVGALPEVIRNGLSGLIAPAGDLPAMEANLRSWLAAGAEIRAGMSNAARETIAERYSIEAGLARILEVYRDALG